MKKTLSLILALVLALGLATSALAQGAATVSSSEEVIYAVLSADGTPERAYGVTAVNVTKAGTLTRRGSFSAVKNLTDTAPLTYSGDKLTGEVQEGRFYYQGDLKSAQLPWTVDITYKLDGKDISPQALGGKSGALEIHITTAGNAAVAGDYRDHYLLQVSVTLDAEKCVNIASDGASVALSGGDKVVTFTVLPGSDGDMTLTADVTEFSMTGMTIAGVPYDLSSALGDASALTDGLTELSDATASLSSGAKKLSDGAANLSVGAAQLNSGAGEFGAGVTALSGSSAQLTGSSAQIFAALQQLNGALTGAQGGVDLSALAQLPSALSQLSGALGQISNGLDQLAKAYPAALEALSGAINAIPAPTVTETDIGALLAANPGSAALKALAENYTAAQTVRTVWQQASAAFTAVNTSLPTLKTSVDTVKAGVDSMSAQLSAAMANSASLSGLAQLTQGMAALVDSYSAFNEGLASYTGGVDALSGSWGALGEGVSALADGSYALQKGSKELSDGAATLSGETAKIPGQIKELTGGDDGEAYVPASFLSEKNTDCAGVQFVIKTAAIEAPEEEAAPAVEEVPNTLWNRFLSLFSWIG
jgi:putative membrane protein